MRTIEIKIFKISELSEKAQEKARMDFVSLGDNFPLEECYESIADFFKQLNCTCGTGGGELQVLNVTLFTEGITPISNDLYVAEELVELYKESGQLGQCVIRAQELYRAEKEDSESLEYFVNYAENNDHEFYEDGSFYSGVSV